MNSSIVPSDAVALQNCCTFCSTRHLQTRITFARFHNLRAVTIPACHCDVKSGIICKHITPSLGHKSRFIMSYPYQQRRNIWRWTHHRFFSFTHDNTITKWCKILDYCEGLLMIVAEISWCVSVYTRRKTLSYSLPRRRAASPRILIQHASPEDDRYPSVEAPGSSLWELDLCLQTSHRHHPFKRQNQRFLRGFHLRKNSVRLDWVVKANVKLFLSVAGPDQCSFNSGHLCTEW